MEAFLANKNLDLDVIITDRNRQNAAYIRRNMAPKGTKHYYDIWHTLLKVSLSIVVVCAYIYIIYAHATIKLLFVEEIYTYIQNICTHNNKTIIC